MKSVFHPASERGFQDHGWLKSARSFSFADYHDPKKMHFGALRVVNDDWIAGGTGFGTHPHENMEIVTIMLSGALKHQDSIGNEYIIRAEEVQRMSAGTGIAHSEHNASETEPAILFQIWVYPKERGIAPSYEQIAFDPADRDGRFQILVSPDRREGSLGIHQNAFFSRAKIKAQSKLDYELKSPGNGIYCICVDGEVRVGDTNLGKRDALGLSETETLNFEAKSDSELLLIEVPMERKF